MESGDKKRNRDFKKNWNRREGKKRNSDRLRKLDVWKRNVTSERSRNRNVSAERRKRDWRLNDER